jgi:hypothetical protein
LINSGWSNVQTVTSISFDSDPLRNVKGVPQYRQNVRNRPAQANCLGGLAVNWELFREKEAHVINAAPLLLRQSKQWQCVTL